jgi:hypothetical protein
LEHQKLLQDKSGTIEQGHHTWLVLKMRHQPLEAFRQGIFHTWLVLVNARQSTALQHIGQHTWLVLVNLVTKDMAIATLGHQLLQNKNYGTAISMLPLTHSKKRVNVPLILYRGRTLRTVITGV